ncbi:MAG: endonuclease III [Campylobacterales bacterium]|nr:endonuclease III [Campylobacterales bacterium]
MKRPTNATITALKTRFLERYDGAVSELSYRSLYELIVAVMLSAQCTDKRVNLITPALFEAFPTIEALSKASLQEVTSLINTCSFFNNKAKNLITMACSVMEEFGGAIPLEEKALMSLAGVGQKTAHVVLIEYTSANVMAVDTHVFRVSHRLGLSRAKTPAKTEEELIRAFKTDLHTLHQAFVLFGRYICTAKNPKCETDCFVREFCQTTQTFKPA